MRRKDIHDRHALDRVEHLGRWLDPRLLHHENIPGVDLRLDDHIALDVDDSAKAHGAHLHPLVGIKDDILVLMPVEDPLGLQRPGKSVDRLKALLVAACGLMSHQDVRPLLHERLVDAREDARAMPPGQPPAPHVHTACVLQECGGRLVVGRSVRHPDLAAENAAQPRNPHARDVDNAAIQIVRGDRPLPEAIIDLLGVRIVVAGNPPHLCDGKSRPQHLFDGSGRLQVAQNHDGVGPVLLGRPVDLVELSVRIPAEKDLRQTLDCGLGARRLLLMAVAALA